MKCNKYYDLDEIDPTVINYCSCGGIIKPDVVLYEEGLNQEVISKSVELLFSSS